MNQHAEPYNLNEAQTEAVRRFRNYHRTCEAQASRDLHAERALEWRAGCDDDSLDLACCCGATLHVAEPIHVTIEPRRFSQENGGSAKGAAIESAPEAMNASLNERYHESAQSVAQESLFQSALVTLPEDTFDQMRRCPSATDMHFDLGLYLRNKFVHSGLLYNNIDPDDQSDGAISRLIKHCIPEFRSYDLLYDVIDSGTLHHAYRYCMDVRGEFPMKEFTKHYRILLEAQEIRKSNPYSMLDDEHYDEWRNWFSKAREKHWQYKLATLREIWNFDSIRKDLGDEVAKKTEEICLAPLHDVHSGFIPSEIAYAMAGSTDDRFMRAFIWAVEDYCAVDHLPDELFTRRDLAFEAVSRRGRQLGRAKGFQDDIEVVLAAVANDPTSIEYASERLQNDRSVLIEAASHANSDLIFFDEPMSKHNDDDELVGLAIDANGANIAYASERFRSSFDWAMRAVTHQRDIYPDASYEYLSDELKQDKRIALAVAQWDNPPHEFPAIALIDDDDIGEALSKKSDRYALFGMSRRIKEKYLTEDELQRWGDDPWWWHENDEADEE